MATPIITAERLRELLHYDPSTGIFTRLVRTSNSVQVGDVAGSKDHQGYTLVCIGGRRYRAHRLAWLYVHGEWPTHQIDHKFGDRSDNRKSELRPATHAQNHQNRRSARSDNRTGLLGVGAHHGRWRARIMVDGNSKNLGLFDTPELAHAAYLEAKAALHPFQTLTGEAE